MFGPGKIVLVGAGNMGGAILKGWLSSGIEPSSVFVSDPGLSGDFSTYLDQAGVSYGPSIPDDTDVAVLLLAIKPQMMDAVLPTLSGQFSDESVIVSVAAGTTISSIKKHLTKGLVIRAMPNTPAMIGRGITGVVAERSVDAGFQDKVNTLLSGCGLVEWVENEAIIDAVTAVSGSGPAYIFYLTECMAEAGRQLGLDADLAMRLARETVSGAGELMRQSDHSAQTLRQNVTSPGGTTAAALNVLMTEDAMQNLFIQALAAARNRAEELAAS